MMIFTHFQLRKPPFAVAPDPECFFLGPANEEPWATLRFVAQTAGSGCLLLGPAGAGKSLHARKLTALRRGKKAHWVNGLSKPGQPLAAAVPGSPDTPDAPLIAALRSGPQQLLVVDNACDLSPLRWNELFHCIESAENAGGRVTLIPVLDSERVAHLDPALIARLRHRCLRSAKLAALDRAQCADYVRFRLSAAGSDGRGIFTTAALNRVYALSGGLPARIHLLCENGLIEAFSENRSYVTPEDIERGATALNLDWGRIIVPDLELPDSADDVDESRIPAAAEPVVRAVAERGTPAAPLNLSLPSGAIWAEAPRQITPLVPEASMPVIELPRQRKTQKHLTPLRSNVKIVAEVWNQLLDAPPRRPARDARRAPRVRPASGPRCSKRAASQTAVSSSTRFPPISAARARRFWASAALPAIRIARFGCSIASADRRRFRPTWRAAVPWARPPAFMKSVWCWIARCR